MFLCILRRCFGKAPRMSTNVVLDLCFDMVTGSLGLGQWPQRRLTVGSITLVVLFGDRCGAQESRARTLASWVWVQVRVPTAKASIATVLAGVMGIVDGTSEGHRPILGRWLVFSVPHLLIVSGIFRPHREMEQRHKLFLALVGDCRSIFAVCSSRSSEQDHDPATLFFVGRWALNSSFSLVSVQSEAVAFYFEGRASGEATPSANVADGSETAAPMSSSLSSKKCSVKWRNRPRLWPSSWIRRRLLWTRPLSTTTASASTQSLVWRSAFLGLGAKDTLYVA